MAGARIPVKVVFKKALQAALLAKRAVDAADRSLKRNAFIMERQMKKDAPVNIGTIHSHIGTVGPKRSGSRVFYEVGVRGVGHAIFVEFGTGPAGRVSDPLITDSARQAMSELGYTHGPGNFMPPVSEIERWLDRKGLPRGLAWPIARKIGRRGLVARPFVFPAFDARKPHILPDVAQAVEQSLRVF